MSDEDQALRMQLVCRSVDAETAYSFRVGFAGALGESEVAAVMISHDQRLRGPGREPAPLPIVGRRYDVTVAPAKD